MAQAAARISKPTVTIPQSPKDQKMKRPTMGKGGQLEWDNAPATRSGGGSDKTLAEQKQRQRQEQTKDVTVSAKIGSKRVTVTWTSRSPPSLSQPQLSKLSKLPAGDSQITSQKSQSLIHACAALDNRARAVMIHEAVYRHSNGEARSKASCLQQGCFLPCTYRHLLGHWHTCTALARSN